MMRIHQAHLKEEQQKNKEIHNITKIWVKMVRSMGMKSIRERLIIDE